MTEAKTKEPRTCKCGCATKRGCNCNPCTCKNCSC